MNHSNSETFDFKLFIDSIIEAMDMSGESPEKVKILRENIETQAGYVILNVVSMNIEPNTLESIMEKTKENSASELLISELIRENPEAQLGILEALDEFKEETLEVYQQLKQ